MTSMDIATRNRLMKKVLSHEFGKGVRVRGSRGTAYGWVTVKIPVAPLDIDHRRELEGKVWDLFRKAGLADQIGTYGYDDPGSDYGHGSKIHINFEPVQNTDPLAGFVRRNRETLEG